MLYGEIPCHLPTRVELRDHAVDIHVAACNLDIFRSPDVRRMLLYWRR